MTDPAPIWHETSRFRTGRNGRPERVFERCVHPLAHVVAGRVWITARCGSDAVADGDPEVRLRRDLLARDLGVKAWVDDKDATGSAYGTAAWFFEGAVPVLPHRPPAWHAFREKMRRMWERHAREAAGRASRAARPHWWDAYQRFLRDDEGAAAPNHAADLAVLGLALMPDAGGLTRAWREAAKRSHPDAPGGDPEAFKRARAAYERLRAALLSEHGAST